MLRPAETTSLAVSSCFGADHTRGRYNRCAVIVAPSGPDAADAEDLALLSGAKPSKTGTFDDTVVLDEHLVESNIRAVYLASLRTARSNRYELLFGGLDYRLYYQYVVAAGKRFQLPFTLTPHMFRHGAASEDFFRQLRDLAAIQQRGRWRCPASVQRYQKSGRLLSVLRRCGDSVVLKAKNADAERLSFLL